MSSLRVTYVLRIFPKLSETFIANELAELRRRGVEVQIVSLSPPRERIRHAIVDRAGLLSRTLYDPSAFRAALRSFRPHVVHAHFATEATAVALDVGRELDAPVTFTAHGYDIFRKPPSDWTARAAAADAVITVSRANARAITAVYGVAPARIRVIPSGIDVTRFIPNGTRAEPPHLVCVARLVPVKAPQVLLAAAAILRDSGRAFRCALVGDGRLRDELEATRAELGLDDIVEFAGATEQDDVRKWWQRAAVAVLTSSNEGLPVALMEAAACGVPAVATAVGGVPELVEDGVTGLLTPAADADALAAAIGELLDDPARAARMGAAARLRAEERYSVRTQVDRLLALWTELADRRIAA